ncbi:MAG: ATP-binding cassette domain-containing protein [Clostridiales bacterium]|jgi:ABC-2 type transport system ATP-binding protein|nr:ATP-binding cassette domain-containing protein [Clostridiales bacterium]
MFYQKQPAQNPRDLFRPRRKAVAALDDVTFSVKRGEFIAYAGPNGAGKSTTIKLLGGMLAQNAGEVSVLGMSPLRDRIAIMRRLGVLFGNRTELWWDHPVSASYRWKRKVWDIPRGDFEEMESLVLDLLDIRPFYNTFARELSLGQRMRADLGMLLLHRPELILLDEPTLGLDVLAKRRMIGFLKELNARDGTTIIVTSHDMDDLEEMARRILLISHGKIAFDGDFSALRGELGLTRKAVVCFADGSRREIPYGDTKTVLRGIAELDGVSDVSFTQASLEEGLAALFERWKAESERTASEI